MVGANAALQSRFPQAVGDGMEKRMSVTGVKTTTDRLVGRISWAGPAVQGR